MDTARTRTIQWEDPAETLRRADGCSGLEVLQAMTTGELPMPPIAVLMGFTALVVSPGSAEITFKAAEYHYNPVGTTQGGVAATLLDAAMWCAVQSTLPALTVCQTLDMTVRYVRPLLAEVGDVTAEAHVVHRGSKVATAAAAMRDHREKLYADATMTSLLLGLD